MSLRKQPSDNAVILGQPGYRTLLLKFCNYRNVREMRHFILRFIVFHAESLAQQGMILETFSLRLNWSTDGSALMGVNSLHPPSHCACILNREQWDAPLKVVGHRGAVTVVRFNPILFQSEDPKDDDPTTCFALGSQVRSASLHCMWQCKIQNPSQTEIFLEEVIYPTCKVRCCLRFVRGIL